MPTTGGVRNFRSWWKRRLSSNDQLITCGGEKESHYSGGKKKT